MISLKVKAIRKEKKYSQLEVANLMGFESPAFFSNAEANRENKYFNLEHIYLLSKIFEIDPYELLPSHSELEHTLLKNSNKILEK